MRFAGIPTIMNMRVRFSGAVLAGGLSSRMGRSKALLSFQGQSMLDRSVHLLHAMGAHHVLISGNVDGYEGIPDMVPHSGPAGGICSLAKHIADNGYLEDWLLIPVDMPLMDAKVLSLLLTIPSGYEAACFEARPLPLFLRLTCNVSHVLASVLQDIRRGKSVSVKHLTSALRTHTVPVTKEIAGKLANTNTPEEWERACNESAP